MENEKYEKNNITIEKKTRSKEIIDQNRKAMPYHQHLYIFDAYSLQKR